MSTLDNVKKTDKIENILTCSAFIITHVELINLWLIALSRLFSLNVYYELPIFFIAPSPILHRQKFFLFLISSTFVYIFDGTIWFYLQSHCKCKHMHIAQVHDPNRKKCDAINKCKLPLHAYCINLCAWCTYIVELGINFKWKKSTNFFFFILKLNNNVLICLNVHRARISQ